MCFAWTPLRRLQSKPSDPYKAKGSGTHAVYSKSIVYAWYSILGDDFDCRERCQKRKGCATRQGLSVATGEGAESLAAAARSGGQTFTAQIPKALVDVLEKAGLATRSVTSMGGVTAQEIRFAPQATEFIVRFFH